MCLMITHFKNDRFLKPYHSKSQTIVDTTNVKRNATYWLLDNQNVDAESSRWESCQYLHEGHDCTLLGMYVMLEASLLNELGIEYEHFCPGFVMTKNSEHQMLHVDSETAFDDEDGRGAMIVHIPLHEEGMWLRVGLVQNTIILPHNQFHGGHYGAEGNLRFHCILSKKKWDGRNLFYIDEYLKKKKVSNCKELIEKEKTTLAEEVNYKNVVKTNRFQPATYRKNLFNQSSSDTFTLLLQK